MWFVTCIFHNVTFRIVRDYFAITSSIAQFTLAKQGCFTENIVQNSCCFLCDLPNSRRKEYEQKRNQRKNRVFNHFPKKIKENKAGKKNHANRNCHKNRHFCQRQIFDIRYNARHTADKCLIFYCVAHLRYRIHRIIRRCRIVK